MPTYNGWNIINLPTYPPAPESIEFSIIDATTLVRSPFTGQQQVFIWGAQWLEASVNMPPLTGIWLQQWFAFLQQLQGQGNVFAFSSAFCAAYPWVMNQTSSPVGPVYWRLKNNVRKMSITHQRVGGLQFEISQAL